MRFLARIDSRQQSYRLDFRPDDEQAGSYGLIRWIGDRETRLCSLDSGASGVTVTNALTYNLGTTANSGIEHVVNDQGASVITGGNSTAYLPFY